MTDSPVKKAFLRSAQPPEQSSTDLLAVIRRECPHLVGKTAYHPDYGINSHTIMFDHEVFKGLLRPAEIGVFEREPRILAHIAGKVPNVPEVTHTGKEAVFYGMTRLPGVALSEIYEHLNEKDKEFFAKSIAAFIRDFEKAFTKEEALAMISSAPLPVTSPEVIAQTMASPRVRAHMGDDAEAALTALQEYNERINQVSEASVCHIDLGGGNILMDPATKRVSGIIDFGGVIYGPLEECFGVLHRNSAGPEHKILHMIIAEYEALGGRKMDYKNIVLCAITETLKHIDRAARQGDIMTAAACAKTVSDDLKELRQITTRATTQKRLLKS